MGFLKNMAIKKVTKKHFNRLIGFIEADQYEFYRKQPEEMDETTARNLAMRTIRNCYKDIGLEAQEITDFSDFPKEPGQQKSWEELLSHLVGVLVFTELSYDPTIGSWEDMNLVKKTFNKQLQKWTHEIVLKKFIRREKYGSKKNVFGQPSIEIQEKAERGDVEAQVDLGLMYAGGKGVKQDWSQAKFWWEKAAAQGDAKAKEMLEKTKSSKAGN